MVFGLYNYFRSTASYRVRIALNYKNINYEPREIHLVNNGGEQHDPRYLQINPQGLVPSLDCEGHVLTQSLAIIEYLEEIFPLPPLLPKTALARAEVRSLALAITADIHPLNNLRVLQYLRQEIALDESQIESWYHHWLQIGFNALEARLQKHQQKFVCFGDEITLADLCLIPQVYNATRFNFSLSNYPCISAINDYCLQIPAFSAAAP